MAGIKYYQAAPSPRGERPTSLTSIRAVEPFRTLFILLGTLNMFLIKLPLFAVIYAFPSMRPHHTWGWVRSLLIGYVREDSRVNHPGGNFSRINLAGDQSATFKPSKNGTPVWIPKLESKLTGELGEMMVKTGDENARCSAWWYGKDHSKQPDGKGKVILYLHGGGYCFASATPTSYTIKPLLSMLATNARLGSSGDKVPLKGLALEYRLSHVASLPGIVSDAVSAWRYLIQDCGYSPSDIVVSGDSAGGHLTLALTRYLVTEKPFGGGIPKGLVLYSPWVDMSLSYVYAGSGERSKPYDYLSVQLTEIASGEALRGTDPKDSLSLYASHLTLARPITGKEFEGFPPAIMHGGELEILHDEDVYLAKHYGDAGSSIEVHFDGDVCHDVYAMPFAFEKECKAAAEITSRWFSKLWA